jgi:hypothetical protein
MACLALVACGKSDTDQALHQYETVRTSGGSARDLCEAARHVADAFLHANNQTEYARWRNVRDINCESARLGG